MDIQEIMKYVLETPENTNPAILKGMLESLVPEDGGGESDFSTAEVTVTNTVAEGSIIVDTIFIDTIDNVLKQEKTIVNTETFPIVLYKGSAEIYFEAEEITSLSGNITADPNPDSHTYIVTGECAVVGKGYSNN